MMIKYHNGEQQDIDTKVLSQHWAKTSIIFILVKVSAVGFLGGCSLLPAKTWDNQKNNPQSEVAAQQTTDPNLSVVPPQFSHTPETLTLWWVLSKRWGQL